MAAGACGLAATTLRAIPLNSTTEKTFVLGIEASDLHPVLSACFGATLALWVLTRCWLKPSRKVLPTLTRACISVPLIWFLGIATLFAALGLVFALDSTHIRVDLEGREEQLLLVVEPGFGDGDATLLRGGPFRYEVIGGPTFIECWNELNQDSIRVNSENSHLTLTADVSESCDQSPPFRIPFALD